MVKITQKLLLQKYKEALEGINLEHGIWTLPAEDCTVAVGNAEDAHGRTVQVQIKVTADETEWLEMESKETGVKIDNK
jgi:hypothetical protein